MRTNQQKEKAKSKRATFYAIGIGAIVVPVVVYLFWPGKPHVTPPTAMNFASIKPGILKEDARNIIGAPPGEYRSKNKGAAPRFDGASGGAEQDIWETDFGGYCIIYSNDGKVVRVDRKPPL